MNVIAGNICSVKGFKALGKAIGIKEQKKDFCVIFSEKPCNAAMVGTSNSFKAAPLIVNESHLKKSNGIAQAIVCVSGVANACTGKKGIEDAELQAEFLANELNLKKDNVLVASTGLIGKFLPLQKIMAGTIGIKNELSSAEGAGLLAAQAIMTTDTFEKTILVEFDGIKIGGIAKGAGMIQPNMATMLCFIGTDAIVSAKDLKKCLKSAVSKSFNMISVDGCMSTNDSVYVLANGLSKKKPDLKKFSEALDFTCLDLAKKIISDGEGGTKVFEVTVEGAKSLEIAKKTVHAVTNSALVKTAMHGSDPNWGRILAAMGSNGFKFKTEKIEVFFNDLKIVSSGLEANFNPLEGKKILENSNFKVKINLNDGKFSATGWGCDLSEEYVQINAEYHT